MTRLRSASRRWVYRRLVSLAGVFGMSNTGPGASTGGSLGLLLALTQA